jgi:geranylgeranyl diphosphate synthase, type I
MLDLAVEALDPALVRDEVGSVLREFLRRKAATTAPHVRPLVATLRGLVDGGLVDGGRRLRPLLAAVGWHTTVTAAMPTAVIRAMAALEMFHAFALVRDGSATRERIPAQRTPYENATGGALLLGDLAMDWSDELLHTCGLGPDRLGAVMDVMDVMRTELMCGRYLGVLSADALDDDIDSALTLVRYRTARYTVERPLHLGAVLAGADQPALDACTGYALPLGEAVELRQALRRLATDPRDALPPAPGLTDRLRRLLGQADLVDVDDGELRTSLACAGARDAIETLIAECREQALEALDGAPFHAVAVKALRALAHTLT